MPIRLAEPGRDAIPSIIQGGMGIGISRFELAGAVGLAGGLGVVSGVALDTLLMRRLADGDPGCLLRRAAGCFPFPGLADRLLGQYMTAKKPSTSQRYRPLPPLTLRPSADRQRLSVLAAFVEVFLAKQAAEGGLVGINLLEKLQMETPAAAYGAMLAGVDVVLVGAGIPGRLPGLLDLLADHRRVNFPVDVEQSAGSRHGVALDPEKLFGSELPRITRPSFLAIVSSHTLAAYLARDGTTRPDGFVVEGSVAGGHNAPPRGPLQLDERGSPIYGPRDEADIDRLRALELPFWVAGARSTPRRLEEALSEGASGVQVGTLFALAEESGLDPSIRCRLLETIRHGALAVDTDPRASPTGYPFKIAQMTGTLADRSVYQARQRLCDLGYLRVPYLTVGGGIGYRCAAEPIGAFVRKGGERTQTVGRMCLCNGLMATAGFPQRRRAGAEVPVVTLGADLSGASELLRRHPGGWRARDVITYLTKKDRSAEAQSESLSAL